MTTDANTETGAETEAETVAAGPCGCDAASTLAAIRDLLCHPYLLDSHEWSEVSQHMTCAGAEAMARTLRLLGEEGEATDLLDLHTVIDLGDYRPHDDHLPREGECLTCRAMPGEPHDPVRCLPDPGDEGGDEGERGATLARHLHDLAVASGARDRMGYVRALDAARAAGASDAQVKAAYVQPWTTRYAGLSGPGFAWYGRG